MKTVAMIPIKMGSKRIPSKNIKRFSDGTPLISFIQKACLRSNSIDEIYVYCSEDSVKDYLVENVHYLRRPNYLDGDNCNCNDIIREFIKVVDADVYVVCHTTSPFTSEDSINACIDAVANKEFDSAFLAKRLQTFLWSNGKPLNFNVQNFPRTQDLDPIYQESSGAFAFSKDTFMKYDRRVGINPYIHEINEIESVDIDYPIDFEIADAIYMEMIKNADTN